MKCQCYGYDYAVIGGDMRQVYLAEELASGAGRVCCYGICADAASVFCAGSLSEFCSLAQRFSAGCQEKGRAGF